MRVPPHPQWHHQAACRSNDPVYRKRLIRLMIDGPTDVAKRKCANCPVVVECLDEAMRNPQLLGVWGGLTARERQHRRNLRRTA